ncbi:unnamed protein product, partial [Symbiodinium sp. CCMP2592]
CRSEFYQGLTLRKQQQNLLSFYNEKWLFAKEEWQDHGPNRELYRGQEPPSFSDDSDTEASLVEAGPTSAARPILWNW